MNIKYIFFDLGNVLLKFSHERGAKQMAELAGVDVEKVQQVVFDGPLQVDYETGRVNSSDFHKYFCEQTGTSVDFEAFLTAGSDIFTFNSQIAPIVSQLRAVNFPLGILSNTCTAHWDFVIQNFPILKHWFSESVLSNLEQSMKPDPKIYQAAIKLAGVKPEQIFFTDDRAENVEGAIAAGIDAVPFHSAQQLLAELHKRDIQFNL